ncbi:hypothetical protein Scep_018818 [Stephania cephalantha]|uniref:Uncharacterized protein n=1 Tax=Stephania cephalantha TaxID=152367 RepID=A0AAP0I9R5_9MAGN
MSHYRINNGWRTILGKINKSSRHDRIKQRQHRRMVVWHLTYENDHNQKQVVVVPSNATLILNKEGSLILRDGAQGKENNIFNGATTSAAMLESRNFEVELLAENGENSDGS